MIPKGGSLLLLLSAIGVDAATKKAALLLLEEGSAVRVLPVLNLSLGFNRGVSFGLFSADGVAGRWVLVALTLAISVVVGWLWHRAKRTSEQVGYAAILGGALGNLIDRVPDGAVTDFVDLHAAGLHFPTFNVADVLITVGVLMLLLPSLAPSKTKSA